MKTRWTCGLVCTALVCATIGLFGCKHNDNNNNSSMSTKSSVSMSAMNDKCCCGAKANPAYSETWNGHSVAFCSMGCEQMFDKMTPAEKDAAVAKAMTKH